MHTQMDNVYIYCHFNITKVIICVLALRNPPLYTGGAWSLIIKPVSYHN